MVRTPYPPRKLHVLLHQRHPLRMYRTQIPTQPSPAHQSVSQSVQKTALTTNRKTDARIFEQMHEVRLRRLLQRQDRRALPPQPVLPIIVHVRDQVQRDLAHLKRQRVSQSAQSASL